jgi:hypothetical protein
MRHLVLKSFILASFLVGFSQGALVDVTFDLTSAGSFSQVIGPASDVTVTITPTGSIGQDANGLGLNDQFMTPFESLGFSVAITGGAADFVQYLTFSAVGMNGNDAGVYDSTVSFTSDGTYSYAGTNSVVTAINGLTGTGDGWQLSQLSLRVNIVPEPSAALCLAFVSLVIGVGYGGKNLGAKLIASRG